VVAHVIVAFLVPEGEGVCLNRPFIAHGCWKIYPIRLNGEVRALNLGGGEIVQRTDDAGAKRRDRKELRKREEKTLRSAVQL
jgi:hypothetical protein